MRTSVALALAFVIVAVAAPALAAQPKVLVLAASSSSGPDVQKKILSTGAFAAVDLQTVYDVTPTLAQLQMYDAVCVYSYLSFKDNNALGDVLATYLESGGGVLLFDYETQEMGSYQMGGRFESTYAMMPLQKSTSILSGAVSLGKIDEVGSPLLAGVTTFSCKSCHHLNVMPGNGGVVVAEWSDGSPLVIRGSVNGHTLVELNFFAPSSTTGIGEWDPTTDGAILMKNALLYVIGGAVKVDKGSIAFADTAVGGQTAPQTITYTNTGMAAATMNTLVVGGANVDDFTLTPSAALPKTIPAGGTFTAQVTFNPTSKGARSATVSANVMGQMNPVVTSLSGNAIGGALAVFPTPVKMGGVLLGGSLSRSIDISNDTNAQVTLTGVSVTVDAAEYSVTTAMALPVTLPVGGKLTAQVKFVPTGSGVRNGTLTLTPMNLPMQTVPLEATAGSPAATLGNGSILYGNQHVGAASPAATGSITNSGFSDLSIKSVALSGANPGDFLFGGLPNFPSVLPPGQTLSYSVIFQPAAAGARAATASVVTDDPQKPTQSYSLGGTGVPFSEMVAPASLDFGMIKGGMAAAAQTATVTNSSAAPLAVKSIAITGPDAAAFSVSGGMAPTQIAPMATLPLQVIFKAGAPGARSATLTVTTDDPNQATLTVALTGVSIAGSISLAPMTIDFGKVAVQSTSAEQKVTATNNGTADLTISAAATSPAAFALSTNPSPVAIKPGVTAVFGVTLTPDKAGAFMGTLTIKSDDPAKPQAVVTLTGQGVQPGLDVAPVALDFGSVPVTVASPTKSLTLTNTGGAPLTITNLALAGPQAAEFNVSKAGPIMLMPGATATVDVRFLPTTVAQAAATLTITPADVALMPVAVALSGNGTSASVSVSPGAFSFGLTDVGKSSAPQTFTLRNNGGVELLLQGVTSTSPTVFVVDASKTELKLGPGTQVTFDATYAPSAAGPVTAQLNVVLKGGLKPVATVNVTGEGLLVKPASGGCTLSPTARPSALAALALLLALAALARRRR